MPVYRRAFQPGGTFFLTLVTHERMPLFDVPIARRCLRESIELARRDHPFDFVAGVLLPDHTHLVLTLPPGDAGFSTRVGVIKARFTRRWLAAGGAEGTQSESRARQAYRGVWQKRFWEHVVRDETDLAGCCDYVHYIPVKHGYVVCPHLWEWSTFHRWVRERRYESNWCCRCDGAASSSIVIPSEIHGAEMDL